MHEASGPNGCIEALPGESDESQGLHHLPGASHPSQGFHHSPGDSVQSQAIGPPPQDSNNIHLTCPSRLEAPASGHQIPVARHQPMTCRAPASSAAFLDCISQVHYLDAGLSGRGAHLTDPRLISSLGPRCVCWRTICCMVLTNAFCTRDKGWGYEAQVRAAGLALGSAFSRDAETMAGQEAAVDRSGRAGGGRFLPIMNQGACYRKDHHRPPRNTSP